MTQAGLLKRNLLFHWRGNLAVLLGVLVGSAVLTGALLVGDSLRGSLADRAGRQLGWVDHALVGQRFFRAEVADGLPGGAAPVLLLRGSLRTPAENARSVEDIKRVSQVTVLGVGPQFWQQGEPAVEGEPKFWDGDADAAVLSRALAGSLGVAAGDDLILSVRKVAALPSGSLLGKRSADDNTRQVTLKVAAVLPDGHPANDFSLLPNPRTPANLYLPLRTLQDKLDIRPEGESAPRANALFVAGSSPGELGAALRERLTLTDWGLRLVVNDWNREGDGRAESKYIALESRRGVIDDAVSDIALKVAEKEKLRAAPTLVYLATWIGKEPLGEKTAWPYSIIAGLDPTLPPPLGPIRPGGGPLKDNDILLVDWEDSPIRAKPGDKIVVEYFEPEVEGRPVEKRAEFTFRGYVPLPEPGTGVTADKEITPEFPGLTDRRSLRRWNDAPFTVVEERFTPEDDTFWTEYRTTPKAYIAVERGRELFGSRFGALTSVRVAPGSRDDPAATVKKYEAALLASLPLEDGGFVFDAVRERLEESSGGSNDFGGLFAGFSFFLIVSALMLVGLLVRLNLDRRAKEVGLLTAAGYRVAAVRRLLLIEGFAVAAAGAALGLLAALGYAAGMLRLFAAVWPDKSAAAGLELYATPLSLGVGFAATLLMSLGAMWWAVRVLNRVPPYALLRGRTDPDELPGAPAASRRGGAVIVGGIVCGAGLIAAGPFVPGAEARAGTFFGGGALLLAAGLAAVWRWLKRPARDAVRGHGWPALARLGSRNASRNPSRSILTAGLLASAAFLLVAVESFRRQPEDDFLRADGGSGGFPLIAQADVPVFHPVASDKGRADLADGLQRVYQAIGVDDPGGRADADLDFLFGRAGVEVFGLRYRPGDDASCLNLFRATEPRLLGVPDALIERGGFKFAAAAQDAENPWALLKSDSAGGAIPAILEKNTAQWMLKVGLGDDITMTDDDGRPLRLRVVGLLQDSPFPSEVLIAGDAFARRFPSREGEQFFLIDCRPEDADKVASVLETGLSAQGLDAFSTRERVAAYLEVQNAYLTTFQLLGGLGLMLGVLGLAVVLVRGVWERRGELALLRSLGYRTRALSGLVLAENTLLLLLGLGVGVIAALVSVVPHLLGGQPLPAGRLSLLLGGVLVLGLLAVIAAVAASVRTPVLAALRRE